MNPPYRLHAAGALSLLMLTLACGAEGSEEPRGASSPAEDPYGGEEPTTAVTLPFEDAVEQQQREAATHDVAPTPAPVPVPAPLPESVAAAAGPAQLVLLHTHELLRSEERYVEQLLSALQRASIALERTPVGDRGPALEAWLTETDPARRARLALGAARGNARTLLVLRVSAPVDRRAQGVTAFGVIAGEPARERLWAQGDLPTDAHAALAALLSEEAQP